MIVAGFMISAQLHCQSIVWEVACSVSWQKLLVTQHSQISALERLGSQTIWFLTKSFTQKMSGVHQNFRPRFSTNNPLTLKPVWPVTCLSSDKGDWVFQQVASETVFQNDLGSRTEVPMSFRCNYYNVYEKIEKT